MLTDKPNWQENLSGIIAVYKPGGWTSFDVVAKLRGILRIKRLGHGGTLDPMAEGVLPVFVGKATKACDIIPDRRKEYSAGFKLGMSTDTQDITGKILTESPAEVNLEKLKAAAETFVGDIMQIPPMYSAVKVNGKKLYELAREGKTVEREPRPIRVNSIEITEYDESKREGKMYVRCEKGTYIRTIIYDIGEKLGTGGVMTTLVRTYSGGCGISDCHTLEEIQALVNEEKIGDIIIPTDKAFAEYEEVRLSKRITELYKNGVKLRPEQTGRSPDDRSYRVYGAENEFLGIGHFVNGEFRSKKNLFSGAK